MIPNPWKQHTMNKPASNPDLQILRALVASYAEAAALPQHREKAELWRRLNGLKPTRPLVWINEIPWRELAVEEDLTNRCEDPLCRKLETDLRKTLYQWRHFPGDMVLDPELQVMIECTPRSSYADYGIEAHETKDTTAAFHSVIESLADVEKLKVPEVVVDWDTTQRRLEILSAAAEGLIGVRRQGIVHQWHSPWDQMIHWYGIERLYMDMVDQPELVHALLGRFMQALHIVVDRQEELGVLDVGTGNHRVGSGGLGFCEELPPPGFDPSHVRPRDQWGCATAQIFAGVSPDMHWEFALQYEKPMMERFGLSYYGCCEPLQDKIEILRRVRNLRKISVSPMADAAKCADRIGRDYVISLKPTPAFLAFDRWDPGAAERDLRSQLQQVDDCYVEVILKDITTVRGDPRRLSQWEKMAMNVVCGKE